MDTDSIDYTEYMKMQSTPAGAVLKHILRRLKMSQKDLADGASMLPQRIHDLIAGTRKFTPEVSLKIENALSIEISGFFYLIQASYSVHRQILLSQKKPDIDKFRKIIFWDADISKIDWQGNANWVIKRIAEYGNDAEMMEIERFYGKDRISRVLASIKHNRREIP